MTHAACQQHRGFTLIELLTALVILTMLAVMSYRGLATVLDTRVQVVGETEKWRQVTTFFARFGRDVKLAAPRPVRAAAGERPAWVGHRVSETGLRLEFSRFASSEDVDSPRRIAYALNDRQEIELWVWSGLDVAPGQVPARYPVLRGVTALELHYLDSGLAWVDAWPAPAGTAAIPRAVRLRLVLASGEEVVRVFALDS